MTCIRTLLDRDLTIRRIHGGCHGVVGKSVFELVLPSHHHLLNTLCRELVDRRRMVSCEIPTFSVDGGGPRWWFVRAAPLCQARRVVATVAHAVPRAYVPPIDWQPVDFEAWQRELALRELLPILQAFHAELAFAAASPPWASRPDAEASGRGSSRPRLRPDRAR